MPTYAKEFLSQSVSGRAIQIAATTTPGTLLHTTPAGTTTRDEVWIYVMNNHTANVTITLEWGGTTIADRIIATVPFVQGLFLLVPGEILNNGLAVSAFTTVTNVLSVSGFVNRITN